MLIEQVFQKYFDLTKPSLRGGDIKLVNIYDDFINMCYYKQTRFGFEEIIKSKDFLKDLAGASSYKGDMYRILVINNENLGDGLRDYILNKRINTDYSWSKSIEGVTYFYYKMKGINRAVESRVVLKQTSNALDISEIADYYVDTFQNETLFAGEAIHIMNAKEVLSPLSDDFSFIQLHKS